MLRQKPIYKNRYDNRATGTIYSLPALSQIPIERHTNIYIPYMEVIVMSEINEQEIADLRMQIDQYRTELEEKTESYLNLKEKYETMKILELDLRHEIYELKKELHGSHIEQESHGKGQGQYNHLKYITTLLEDMHKLLDKSISQPYYQLNLDKQHSKMIHRPAKENNKAIGLGKESMFRMKDNHEKNGPRHEENEQKNSLNENNQEMTKVVTEKNMQKLMQSEQVNRENKNNNEPVKSEVKSFKELKKLVNNLKDQENSSVQQQNQTVTDHPSETKQDHIQKKESVNQSKDFTFRDLQQAQHIYSKPLSRMNTTTTTSINRQIQKKEIRKDQSSNKPVFIEETTSNEIGTQQNKPPKSDRTQ